MLSKKLKLVNTYKTGVGISTNHLANKPTKPLDEESYPYNIKIPIKYQGRQIFYIGHSMFVILQILTFQLVDLIQKLRHLETIQKIISIVPFTQHYGFIEARQIPKIKLNFERC